MKVDIYIVSQKVIKIYGLFLPNFVVACIDNTFLNKHTVLVSTSFCIFANCLCFSRCFAVPCVLILAPTAIGIIYVFNYNILSTSIWKIFIF